jgi:hypothetical protein
MNRNTIQQNHRAFSLHAIADVVIAAIVGIVAVLVLYPLSEIVARFRTRHGHTR